MPRGDGTGPLGIGPTGPGWGRCVSGLRCQGFGSGQGRMMHGRGLLVARRQFVPDAATLEERDQWRERRAAICRTLAGKTKETNTTDG